MCRFSKCVPGKTVYYAFTNVYYYKKTNINNNEQENVLCGGNVGGGGRVYNDIQHCFIVWNTLNIHN